MGATVEGDGRLYISALADGDAVGASTVWFDGVQVEEGSIPTSFSMPESET